MSEPHVHRFTKAINDLLLYCPDKYVFDVWNESRIGFWAWKEQELLSRCYNERGFIQKLEALVEQLKKKKHKPHKDQSPSTKYNYRDHGKLVNAVSG